MKKSARLIGRAEVLSRVNLSYPTVWRRMREGNFPRSRDHNGKSAWIESEIDEYIQNLPIKELKPPAEVA